MNTPSLILASTSRYRRELLARLQLEFRAEAPGIDESPAHGERPVELASRLAREKALAVGRRHPGDVAIGSDQVAVLGDTVLGKPGTAARCVEQLLACSGQRVSFLTAVCVAGPDGRLQEHVDTTVVVFRRLSGAEVERYVELESPLDCAGGFKCEALGITLFERIESVDPTALVGLPLIWVAGALRSAGFDPLTAQRGQRH
jgi:septum formation protein